MLPGQSLSTAQPAAGGAAAGGAAAGGSMSEQDMVAAKAKRDKLHTTKLSAKVHDQMAVQLEIEARKEAALKWFLKEEDPSEDNDDDYADSDDSGDQ